MHESTEYTWSYACRNLSNVGPPPSTRAERVRSCQGEENRHTKLSVTQGLSLTTPAYPRPECSHIPQSNTPDSQSGNTEIMLQVARKGNGPIWTGVITSCAPLSVVILSPVFGYLVSACTPSVCTYLPPNSCSFLT
jgi:hypothetical protein